MWGKRCARASRAMSRSFKPTDARVLVARDLAEHDARAGALRPN